MQIVEKIVTSGKDIEAQENRKKWIDDFCKKGGLRHFYQALINHPLDSIKHPLTRSCFRLILKLLYIVKYIGGVSFEVFIPGYNSEKEKLNERIFQLLEAFADFSILPANANKRKESESDSITLSRNKHKQTDENSAVLHGFKLLQGDDGNKYRYFEQLIKYPHFKELLLRGLILSDNPFLQNAFKEELSHICTSYKNIPYLPNHPHVVLLPLLFQIMIKETLNLEDKSQEFYKLLCGIIAEINTDEFMRIPINLQGTLDYIANLLKNHEIREKKSTDTDYVLIGLLNVLRYLAEKFPQQNEFVGQKCGIVKEILFHYLFEFPKAEKIQKIEKALPPKCKSSLSRQSAFSLLASLARDTPINIKEIIAFILPIHMYDCIIKMNIETVHGELKESLIGQLYQTMPKNHLLDMLD